VRLVRGQVYAPLMTKLAVKTRQKPRPAGPAPTGSLQKKRYATRYGMELDWKENWRSRPDGSRSLILRGRRRGGALLSRAAGLAHTWTGFQKRHFAACETTIVDKFIARRATGPAAGEEGLVPIEPFVAHLAVPGFNPQQHRLPISAAFSDAHSGGSIAKRSEEKQAMPSLQHGRSEGPIPRTRCLSLFSLLSCFPGSAPVIDSTAPIERAPPRKQSFRCPSSFFLWPQAV